MYILPKKLCQRGTYIQTYLHTCMHTYIQFPSDKGWVGIGLSEGGSMFIYIHTYMHAYIHTYIQFPSDKGWVGIGLSEGGSMFGADIVIVRKKGDTWVAEDMHATVCVCVFTYILG